MLDPVSYESAGAWPYLRIINDLESIGEQAGAELCQAQGQFGLAWFGLVKVYFI